MSFDSICIYVLGYFECQCPNTWNGLRCEVYDEDFPGGIGRSNMPTLPSVPEICQKNLCPEKADNGVCDVSYHVYFFLM